MGAIIDTRVYEDAPRDDLKRRFRDACSGARPRDHEGYSGTIAEMCDIAKFFDKEFPSENDAYSFISDNHQKWDDAFAVSFFRPAKETERDRKRKAKAKAAYDAVEKQVSDAARKIIEAFFEAKSRFVTCKSCSSKLKRSLLPGRIRYQNGYAYSNGVTVACPLCKTELLSVTALNRIKAGTDKLAKAKAKFEEANKSKPSKKKAWLIGGWCSS